MINKIEETTNPFDNKMDDNWFFKELEMWQSEAKPLNQKGSKLIYENIHQKVSVIKVLNNELLKDGEEVKENKFYTSKHFHFMTHKEKRYLLTKISFVLQNKTTISKHAEEKLVERNIDISKLKRGLNSYYLVEFRVILDDYYNLEERRVTIKAKDKHEGKFIYIVLSLDKCKVVTIYSEKLDFFKWEIAMNNEKYDADMNVIEMDKKPIKEKLKGYNSIDND